MHYEPKFGSTESSAKPDRGALFILPIRRGKDASKLAEELEAINDRLLLFLTYVRSITFRDETSEETREWVIAKTHSDGVVTIENTLLDRRTRWQVFSRELRVPRDRPEIRVGPKKKTCGKKSSSTLTYE